MLVENKLAGKSILVIEDDFIDELRIAFECYEKGGSHPYNVREQTIALLEGSDIGAAILDGHLDRETSEPIADALKALGIPFVNSEFDVGGNGMEPAMAELTLLAHQIFGPPTFH